MGSGLKHFKHPSEGPTFPQIEVAPPFATLSQKHISVHGASRRLPSHFPEIAPEVAGCSAIEGVFVWHTLAHPNDSPISTSSTFACATSFASLEVALWGAVHHDDVR